MQVTKQIVFTAPGKWKYETVELPPLKDNEVLVKVEACGLCTWERQIFSGEEPAAFPFLGGHEIAATIVAKGSHVSEELKPGDPVAVAKWDRCNQCYECRRGFDNHCPDNFKPAPAGAAWGPGGFSEYLIAKSYEVFPLAKNMPVYYGALTEPLACVTRSVRRVYLEAGDTAVVIGAGLMGLLFLKALKLRGIKTVVVQRSAYRRQLAAKMGADLVVDPLSSDWVEVVNEYTKGQGAQAVFYTAGGAQVLNRCLKAASIGGYVLIYAPLHLSAGVLDADEIHYRELVVLGSIRHDKESFREAAALIGEGRIDLSDLSLQFGSFLDFEEAMKQAAENREIHRVLLTWEKTLT